jgi:hypothetical protein
MKFLAFIFAASIGCWALAQMPWELTGADFKTQAVDVRAMNAGGVDYRAADGSEHHLPMDQFLELRRGQAPMTAGFALMLMGGDRVAGQVIGMDSEHLRWQNPLLGELVFPVRQVSSIRLWRDLSAPSGSDTEDVVHLSNGDTVRGVVGGMNERGVNMQTASASPTISWSGITAIDFASLGSPSTRPASGWRVSLDDGSVLRVDAVQWSAATVDLSLDGQRRSVKSSNLRAVEQIDGPVVFLSSIRPAEDVQIPLLGAPRPAKFGEGHSIFVRAYSRLLWNLPAGFSRLHLQYAIDANLPLADVMVRVQIDGKTVYEEDHLHAGFTSSAMQLPLNHGRQLTLEVDTDNPYRTQGLLTWISPALVR